MISLTFKSATGGKIRTGTLLALVCASLWATTLCFVWLSRQVQPQEALAVNVSANGDLLGFNQNYSAVATAGKNGTTISLWRTSSREKIGQIVVESETAQAIGFSPDGKTVAASWSDNSIRVWDLVLP